MTDLTASQFINSRYRLQDKLGEGGMGTVYRAADRLTGQIIALKRVTAAGDQLQFASQSTDQDFRLSLAQEFRTLAGLRHPHIVSVLDYGFDEQRQPFFTMQLVEGAQELTDYAAALPTSGKVRVLIETLQALAYLHRRGIIHRDLKPGNVLVTAEGSVRVMDFGLALHQSDSITNLHTGAVGTLAYMAPELFADEKATVASDLYAVGVMVYELFAGKYPFNIKNLALLINSILNDKPDTTGLDYDLAEVVDRLLTKNPDQRYDSADAVIEALCTASNQPVPVENAALRESFLQAAKFVGRDAELGQLVMALDRTIAGQGSTWLIGGESGVGKSRLLDELRTRALVEGIVVIRGQAVEGGGLPYQLWRDPLSRLLLSTELTELEASILKPLVSDISDLPGREIPDAPDLPGEAGQQRLTLTIGDVFKRYPQPVLLLLEDLQWASESLIPLKRLNDLTEELPMLIVGTYRDDETPTLAAELPGMQVLKLTRLADDEIVELSESMLGTAGQQPALLELLKRETEGNTFFMVEVVRALAQEAGALREIGHMTLPRSILAGGVQQIVRRRLDRIPPAMSWLLKLAAVAGRQPDFKILKAIDAANLDDFVTACAGAAVLEIVEDHWRFTHDKLRETVLADLDTNERPALHRRVAEAIEEVYPGDEVYADVLMEHWHQAGDQTKEWHYAILAGNQVYRISAHDEALNIYQRALKLIALEQKQDDELSRQQALLKHQIGDILRRMGHYAKATEALEESQALAAAVNDQKIMAQALIARGITTGLMGFTDEAVLQIEKGVMIARRLNDLPTLADGLAWFAVIPLVRSRTPDIDRAIQLTSEGLALSRATGNKVTAIRNLYAMGHAYGYRQDWDNAEAVYQEGLSLSRLIGDRNEISIGLTSLSNVFRLQRKLEASRLLETESLAMSRELHIYDATLVSLINLSLIETEAHNFQAADAWLKECLQLASNRQTQYFLLSGLANKACIWFYQGNSERAAEASGLVLHHPLADKDTLDIIDQVLARLQTEMTPEEYHQALDRGKTLDLDAVIAEILAEA